MTQPPQNQWNNNQPEGQAPQVKPLPPNWQQPVQSLWNPAGEYGGAPEPKGGLPGWALALIAVLVVAVVAGVILIVVSVVYKPNYQTPPESTLNASSGQATQRPTSVPTKANPTATVVAVVTTAKAQAPAPTPLPPPVLLTVNSYRFQSSIEPKTVKAGFTYFIVDFTLRNNSQSQIYLSLSSIKVQSKEGYSYEYASVSYELQKSLKQTNLGPGEVARGELAYEVPANDTLVSGRYEDIQGNKVTVSIG